MKSRRYLIPSLVAALGLMLAGCVQGPPSTEQVVDEFDDVITPAWTADVPGIYGQPAVAGDLVAVYAQDETDGMRLEVHSTETGKLLWQHVASPGGAWGAPLFSETNSASRPYPIPTIQPFVVKVGKGDKAKPMVVFTERVLTEDNQIYNPDVLHVADLRTGKELKLSAPNFVEFESPLGSAEPTDDGGILVQEYSPYRLCGDEPTVCVEDNLGGFLRIDLTSGEVTNSTPEFDPFESGYQRDYGAEYVQIIGDEAEAAKDVLIAKLDGNGEEVWRVGVNDLFGDSGGVPAELRDFAMADGVLLVQGYRPVTENLDTGRLTDDYTLSRTLAGLDPDTGKVLWTDTGVDALCYAVADAPRSAKTKTVPVCHATAGSFEYDKVKEVMVKQEAPVVSIAELGVTDGSLSWEVEHAGDQAVLEHVRQIDAVFSSGSSFAVVDTANKGDKGPKIGLLDLESGKLVAMPAKAGYLCESERDGVKLKFQGSVFVSGRNPIALEYPAGWYQFPCGQDAAAAKKWTEGAVRVGGIPAGAGRVIVVTEKGLAGFEL